MNAESRREWERIYRTGPGKEKKNELSYAYREGPGKEKHYANQARYRATTGKKAINIRAVLNQEFWANVVNSAFAFFLSIMW